MLSSPLYGDPEEQGPLSEVRCSECGQWNASGESRCGRCGRRLDGPSSGQLTRLGLEESEALPAAADPAPPKPSPQPEWKQELNRRLAGYREKQSGFVPEPPEEPKKEKKAKGSWIDLPEQLSESETPPPAPPRRREVELPPPRKSDAKPTLPPPISPRVEDAKPRLPEKGKSLPEPPLTEESPSEETLRTLPPTARRVNEAPEPPAKITKPRRGRAVESLLAPLPMRLVAGLMDTALVSVALGVFLGIAFAINRQALTGPDGPILIGVVFAGLLIFYWLVFLIYLGRTAGMTWMGLRVVNFDGLPPDEEQRRHRAFGTVLSAAALGVGFVWSLADEQKLTWHDRISKTFVAVDEDD